MVYTCGATVMVWLNNKLVVDCDTTPRMNKPATGGYNNNFAFQLHKKQDVEVRYKDIHIMTPTYVDEDGMPTGQFIGCALLR